MIKVLVGMSGGVDSSVAAALLLQSGFDTAGATLRLYDSGGAGNIKTDAEDAAAVCGKLGIEHTVIDLRQSFCDTVIGNFVSEYACGRTPNPCLICNKKIKFGAMLREAHKLGFDKIATGHYARIEENGGRFLLKKAVDASKDQSYVLYSLSQEQLGATELPLGSLTKNEVRELAAERGFINADRPDSQDICFVPDGDYAAFITEKCKKSFEKGNFVDMSGRIIGEHRGIIHYTVGQRKGLRIAMGRPVFVLDKDAEKNTVVIGDEPELFYKRVEVSGVNFIPFDTLSGELRVKAKLRYRHTEQSATLHPMGDNGVLIEFDEPQRAPSPGQAAVFYDGEYVLGGGIIERGIK